MAVENYICPSCQCFNVCEVKKKIVVFHEEAKKQLGMDIEIKSCEEFKALDIQS